MPYDTFSPEALRKYTTDTNQKKPLHCNMCDYVGKGPHGIMMHWNRAHGPNAANWKTGKRRKVGRPRKVHSENGNAAPVAEAPVTRRYTRRAKVKAPENGLIPNRVRHCPECGANIEMVNRALHMVATV